MDFIYVLYNLNNPDNETLYSTDLFDLFGSPDGLTKGFVYSIKKSEHKKLRWDWGISGFKNVVKALYYQRHSNLKGFSDFYNKFLASNLKLKEFFNFPLQALYQVKPKKDNSVLFPAFIMNIYDIEKEGNRIYLSFIPDAYFIVDPEAWKNFLITREDYENWKEFCDDSKLLQDMLKAPAQAQHRIYPAASFNQMINLSPTSSIFFKKLDLSDRRMGERDVLDNQIFWNMYQYFTKHSQVIGKARFKYKSKAFQINGISTNTLSKGNACYKQEIGTPQAICSALSSCFEDEFIYNEFDGSQEIHINQSKYFKRAFQIKNFRQYNDAFANTDYDYVVDLNPLGINKVICFDLTVGLWNKGRDKSIEDYIKQWKHNIVSMPKNNSEIITVFAFGINEKADNFFRQQSSFETLEAFINTLVENDDCVVYDGGNLSITASNKIFFIPFFANKFNVELEKLMENPRESLMYKFLFKLLCELKKEFKGGQD